MSIHPRRPRLGRLLDWLAITLFLSIFVGLAYYHYRRLPIDPGPIQELTERRFEEIKRTEAKDATHVWPQWRGPNRDGISTETGILTEWPKDGPKELWQAKIGEGFSSVAVALGRVFTIFQDGPNESVICWDAATGREIWRYSYECAFKNSYGNGPRSTPSIDENLIYTVGGTGIMHCLEADTNNAKGKLVWTKKLLEEFSAPSPRWGVAFSPLVEGDRIFIMPGGRNGAALAALDKKTGNILWQKHDDSASYSSPIACTIDGQRQILFLTGTRLISVLPTTGERLWDFPWPIENETNIATPIVIDDFVFISSSYNKGGMMVRITKNDDAWEATPAYRKPAKMRNHHSSCVRLKDHLYGFDDSTLVCMDFKSGKTLWDTRGFDKGSVLLVGDQLIVYGANGFLALAEATPREYVEKAKFRYTAQDRECWSVPVLADGRLYVRDRERIVCLNVKAAR